MDEQESTVAAKASDPLYDWWFGALPALFGAAGSRRDANAAGLSADPTTARAEQALKLSQQLFESLGGAYFSELLKRPADTQLAAFAALMQSQLARITEAWSGTRQALDGSSAESRATLAGLMGSITAPLSGLSKPLAANAELVFGGLADAFGLAPLRELDTAGRGLAAATLAKQQAQADYLGIAAAAVRQGIDATIARLAEMKERGESVDTMRALMRLCATTVDDAVHRAMQSPRALQAASKVISTSLQERQYQQSIVAMVSEALNVPTRAEVDEAYREIQELKRELRRLRKGTAATRRKDAAPAGPPVSGVRAAPGQVAVTP